MNKVIIVIVVIVILIIVIVSKRRPREEYLLPSNKEFIVKEARQGVAVDGKYFYAISDNTIGKYHKKSGKHVLSKKLPFKHLNGGKIINGDLVLTDNPKDNENTVVWVNPKNLKVIDTLQVQVPGSLTWVDFAGGMWWVCSAWYKKNVRKTRIMCFDADWNVHGDWKLPKKLLNKLSPWSLSGGAWLGNVLFVAGHDLPELYALTLGLADTHAKLIKVVPVCFNGQGFSFDGKKVWGIRRKESAVVWCELN